MSDDSIEFDFRRELLDLFYLAGQDFDKRLKVLALMEKVGGFVKKPRKQDTQDDPEQGDPVARRVIREINGQA